MTKKVPHMEHLEKKLGYVFKSKKLLEKALTHSSYSNENKSYKKVNNERLEFLGDSVLGIVVSRYIYKELPNYPEGDLSKLRAQVVCEDMLNRIALKLGIGKFLVLGKGEEATGGRVRKSILADAVEAIIAAIYLDGSLEDAERFILNILKENIHVLVKRKVISDYKSHLQEYFQSKDSNYKIKYIVSNEEGPDHDKTFYIDLLVNKKKFGSGSGKSKKIAEQNAAKKALIKLGELYNEE